MKHTWMKRAAAAGLALMMTGQAAYASEALGHDLHSGSVDLSVGTSVTRQIFWSDTYSDLRTERYLTYQPSTDVNPTVAYGDKVLSRATLASMAKTLENQGKRVVGGVNGDYYVFATGAPVGLVISGGVIRSATASTSAWYYGVGFRADGTAFIGRPALSVKAAFQGVSHDITGGINKIRTESGGYTLLTGDFAATTGNTSPGVDVILSPLTDGEGETILTGSGAELVRSSEPIVGGRTTCVVEQVLESEGSIPIPEGKWVLTINGKGDAGKIEALKALQPGDTVDIDITSEDERWAQATEALGAPSRLLTDGALDDSFTGDSNANTRVARTAVGIKADGTVIFYTIDGGQSGYSVGCTLRQAALRLKELGCVDAVAMDGGGSTTLGAAYPGGAMEILNKPSEGTQRANSTAIFLTTTLAATGELGSYYVTPGDSLMLSGAVLQLKATALDTAYYPMADPNEVSFSIRNGDGTITADGLFTAGDSSGTAQIVATGGSAAGTAGVTVVRTPDAISLSNEKTGKTLSRLDVSPGAQVDLKANASYRKLALVSQDTCYTWSCDPAVGTVDANGVFTAVDKSASGAITVSAGGKSVSLPVSVAGHILALETCEGSLSGFTSSAGATASAETGTAHVKAGRQSLKMTYDAAGSGMASLATDLRIPEGECYLGLWVYGDGSGNSLTASAADESGAVTSLVLTALDFTGWKHVLVELPEGTAAIRTLSVVYGGGKDAASGAIWLDHFTTSNESVADATAPTVTVTVSGSTVTASVTDDVDRAIPAESVVLTCDGTAVDKTWNESTGTLTAQLSLTDGKAHRVTVTAVDTSGNLARNSADVEPSAENANVFGDMEGHWAARFASYLYQTGVTSGTGDPETGLVYAPDRSITRGEFFALVARWMKVDLSRYADVELPFVDGADIPSWALGEIKAMYSLGIVSGAGSDSGLRINAGANISRAEVMAILGRTQPRGYATPALTAADRDQVPAWALEHVQSLVGQGVVAGYGGKINPNQSITRGEVAKLLYSML